MRVSGLLRFPASTAGLQWLAPLKSAQLQHVARATGIQSSGTKAALLERIQSALPINDDLNSTSLEKAKSRKVWSILSIDMGIQNLAFAHLRVPNPHSRRDGNNPPWLDLPELTAWRRLAVSEVSSLDLVSETDPAAASSLFTALSHAQEQKSKDSYSPNVYAANAYTLINSLLSAYKPTHILIERQRFRSGGASAVQEWTLRVGVFEGMLYAILHALRQERGGDLAAVQVLGIEPKRVVGYWAEIDGAEAAEQGESGKRRASAREVKKAKIDLVGRWLANSLHPKDNGEAHSKSGTASKATLETPGGPASVDAQNKISLGTGPTVTQLANAYVQKWQKPNSKKKRSPTEAEETPIGKLDDLADCLLQGVTWYEWQIMRERLSAEGFKALDP